MPDENTYNNVGHKSAAHERMAARWELLTALREGSDAMRAGGEIWLPKEPAESLPAYRVRLARSFLYTAYDDTIEKLKAKPFSRPVTIQGELPEALQAIEENADAMGATLHEFANEVMDEAIDKGLTHILVDYAQTGGNLSLAEERNLGLRPYFAHIKPWQLLGGRARRLPNGELRLSMVRILEHRTEVAGRYGEVEVPYIRVIGEGWWELHRFDAEEDTWVKLEEGLHTFPEGVPLVTLYFNRQGFLEAKPPLWALAQLNLRHYQSWSDQTNILRFARTGVYFGKGFTNEEIEKGITIGPKAFIGTTNPDADLKVVEHTGAAIEAGENDIKRLEERMEVLGLQPMVERSVSGTATGSVLSEMKSVSMLQAWVMGLEDALRQAYEAGAMWIGEELDEEFKVDVYNDFALSKRPGEDLKILQADRARGDLDHETYLTEVRRRGVLSEAVEVEDIMERVKAEGPTQDMFNNPPDDDEDDDEEDEE